MPTKKIVCTVPTYNEAENIIPLATGLLALGPQFEVLVVDDDSPDGTSPLVEAASRAEPRLHLLCRKTDRGRGAAGRDGFVKALEMGADVVVEMEVEDRENTLRYLADARAYLLSIEEGLEQ